ncbi:hypothetical protein EGW08_007115, partial [Elysia chlorotica]
MKILTWNINGIRAVTGKTGVKKMLDSLDAHVVCLQETKVTRDMLDEPTAIVDGYESYFSFSRKRTGYSGTANYCSRLCTPVRAEEGLTGRLQVDEETSVGCFGNTNAYSEKDLEALDAEGRCVITQHRLRLKDGVEKEVAIINVYVPRAGDRPDRLEYKLRFLTLLQNRAQALLREHIHVIILGDLNLTHTAKDNCDPKSDADFLRRSSRVWINNLLRPCERDPNIASSHPDLDAVALRQTDETLLFSDAYRYLHPEESTGYTNWDTSTDARKSNYGRRLDYILVDTGLAGHVIDCRILTEVEGSDHCPVVVTLDCQPLPCTATSPPQLCSKLMPEFRGQQQKLSSFFTKTAQASLMSFFAPKTASSTNRDCEPLISSRSSDASNEVIPQEDCEVLVCLDDQDPVTTNCNIPNPSSNCDEIEKASLSQGDTDKQIEDNANSTRLPLVSSQEGKKNSSSSQSWKSLLCGPAPPPLCPGHKEPCVLKTVRKNGPNKNKQFYSCPRPDGPPGNTQFRCNFFQWLHDWHKKK